MGTELYGVTLCIAALTEKRQGLNMGYSAQEEKRKFIFAGGQL